MRAAPASAEPVESVTDHGVYWRLGDWTGSPDPGPLAGDGAGAASAALPPVLQRRRRIGRLWARDLVTQRLGAEWTGFAPDTPRHKPRLAHAGAIDVSIAHSGRTLLVAVVAEGIVGVDVEEEPFDAFGRPSLIRRMCSTREAERIAGLPDPDRRRSLARAWTVKEATLKAYGIGLAGDPARIPTETVPMPGSNSTGPEFAIVQVDRGGEHLVELPGLP